MYSNNIFQFREWMYNRIHEETGEIREEFKKGLTEFMQFATTQEISRETGKMSCPCIKCDNEKFINIENVWRHCYWRGFTPGYFVWFSHGEDFSSLQRTGENSQSRRVPEESGANINVEQSTEPTIEDNTVQMVNDAHRDMGQNPNVLEEPNLETRRFFEMLDAAKQPIYDGCKEGHSPLSAATRMMNIKTEYNLSEDCVDAIADFVKEYLPEENFAPASYYAIQKLVSGLGLPFQIIDVCKKNCMIFWKEDASLEACKFCGAQRYKISTGRSKIPHQRMWYLPLADRLKRLYQSERTASAMRWHAEHQYSGNISHPSDAEAWKHFCTTYPAFSSETRNVYLGLCTDGFNPFGKSGRKYSLWPVIITPYNLPPALCMKKEFLFLSILVPGPNHPRRSLDVFLQPLIEELQHLWHHGVTAFDVSNNTNFNLRAVLMWTISDFPAYGMLSGWTTHGRLACPYCQDNTDAFQLKHGRKSSWFDCHRRFLPYNHPYRRNRSLFKKNRVVTEGPPPVPTGAYIVEQLRDFDVDSTIECGGNDHTVVGGYGDFHNWHKKSIFWELPYWKDHLLRHNLDVMHIEKNVFDNIINTILNVQGKTKDNIKSRMDLPDICVRPSLHLIGNSKGPIPIFRLSTRAKNELFRWITEDVRFSDGYASNLSRCVDEQNGKFSGMKSHDSHVFMQRLLPFALSELLPKEVHESIAGTYIYTFLFTRY